MCGISGKLYFNDRGEVDEGLIKKMNAKLAHRGPDDQGVFVAGPVGLGHSRLSIIDLSGAGHQPMPNTDQTIWITYNGEIYNFLELKKLLENKGYKFRSKTDTEVIIYLYQEYGEECLKYLRGMFAFAIWDNDKKQLFLARDRLGKKPLKYYLDPHKKFLIFASELKALFEDPEINSKKEIDYQAIDEYLTYSYVPHPKTGFKNIYKLEPAHYLIIKQDGSISKNRYWQLDFSKKLFMPESEWKEQVISKLKESVKMRLMSDVPLGAHLSGGVDSSLIVALMSQETKNPVKTFSIGFKENDYNELPFARQVSERYKTEHYEFSIDSNMPLLDILPKLVYQYEEPYADASSLPTWYLSEITGKHIGVALNGDGGDENFAGYNRYNAGILFSKLRPLPFKDQLKSLNKFLYQNTHKKVFQKSYKLLDSYNKNFLDFYLRIIDYFGREEKEFVYTREFSERVSDSRWQSFISLFYDEARSKNFDLLDKMLYIDINAGLPGDLLVKVDIASMAHGLEIRSPFLDHEFMELTAKMPSDLKLRDQNKKYILKQIAYDYLPKGVIDRRKHGFEVPLEHWFRGSLYNYIREELLDSRFISYGFRREGIEKLLSDHKNFHDDYSKYLWALLMLKKWLETWF